MCEKSECEEAVEKRRKHERPDKIHDRSIGFEVKTLSNCIKRSIGNQVFCDELEEMSGMQGWIIRFLFHQDPGQDIFQKDVEKEFDIRRSTVTGVLQNMEKNGLLRRESVEGDARLKKLILTPKAITMHQEIGERFDRFEENLRATIKPGDLEVFFQVIDQVKKNLN